MFPLRWNGSNSRWSRGEQRGTPQPVLSTPLTPKPNTIPVHIPSPAAPCSTMTQWAARGTLWVSFFPLPSLSSLKSETQTHKPRQTEPKIDPDLFFTPKGYIECPTLCSTALQRWVQRLPVSYEHCRGLEEGIYWEGCGGVCPRWWHWKRASGSEAKLCKCPGMGGCSREGDINHKQFGRALRVRAQSGDRYCGQSFWAKGL